VQSPAISTSATKCDRTRLMCCNFTALSATRKANYKQYKFTKVGNKLMFRCKQCFQFISYVC
jgi:hypothetical protein